MPTSSTAPLVRREMTRREAPMAYVLWFGALFGFAGLHRIYMGRWLSGIIWLFTFGLCGVGHLIDLFMMPKLLEDSNEGLGW